ncbi:MAG: prepilin peptidase [Halanaerobiaceae bacterium]
MPELLVFITGLIIGSFLNVVIYRLPRNESIVFPASHCPECGTRLRVPDLVPVVSFLIYRGRCRYCRSRISRQYLAVELSTGILLLLLFINYDFTAVFFVYSLLSCLLLVCSVIDLQEMIIPNKITYPGIVLGLSLTLLTGHQTLVSSLLGIIIPGGLLFLIAVFYQKGLGFGDVKLIAMIGAFAGWLSALVGLFLGSLMGTIFCLPFILTGSLDRKTRIPFGPLISLGAVMMLIWGEYIINIYLGLL